ncbi:PREDICTED: coiled-coil domain-containing protein 34-like [Ceratosolen solmsi marchali]|uniref:Coiled-coil domain-containing protein 34-like n=1 Tax=Ceratosolen solmsi marchali TaxID=326594 RepID=A0AAJ7DUE7_9HYME|nr:PREDICTED: coiled-coil domain-containing protein 34-like [Ceratosolen solmsi marchali]
MNEETEVPWSSGLIRSYSQHATVVLQHFQQHRSHPESVKYSRSSCELRNKQETLTNSNIDHENELNNYDYQSWRLSNSLSEDEKELYNRQNREITQIGFGDSSGLTSQFSEISLEQRNLEDANGFQRISGFESTSLPSTSQIVSSSTETGQILSNDDSDYQLLDERSGRKSPTGTTMVRAYSSSNSLAGTAGRQRLGGVPIIRQISYENWTRDKQRQLQRRRDETRRMELKRAEAEDRERQEQKTKQRQEYQRFLDWLKRKKHEKLLRRELVEKELELERQLHEVERKAQISKNIGLMQWHKKKEKQMKATEKEELMKQRKAKEEKERRLEESLKAYEKWRQKSKNVPKPATQGLLPHQKAKPAFTNPTPWKSLIDNASDDSDSSTPMKTTNWAVKNPRSKRTYVKR